LRKAPDVRVVLVYGGVVVVARDGDAVLGAGQLVLQHPEVLIRFQVRIRLDDGEQSAECAGELGVGGRHRFRIPTPDGTHQPCARVRDLREHLLLVRGVSFHGFHEIADQIGAALQLDLDLRLVLLRALVEALDGVIAASSGQ
jgi:hypothetical protein